MVYTSPPLINITIKHLKHSRVAESMRKFKRTKNSKQKFNERKRKLTPKVMWGIVFIVLMIGSVAGYVALDFGGDIIYYNDIKFEQTQQGWETKYQGQTIVFANHPQIVESIPLSNVVKQRLKYMKVVQVTFDPEDPLKEVMGLTAFELVNMFTQQGIYAEYAFTKNNSFNKPIIDCKNATESSDVLLLTSGDTTEVTFRENCLRAQATTQYDFLALRDRLLYHFVGVE
jgi:hypothetical protein